MNAIYKKAVETRQLYQFEHKFFADKSYLRKPRSVQFLRAITSKMWAKCGRKNTLPPSINIVDGAKFSYCFGRSKIVLATCRNTRDHFPHNTVDSLLHELTHALGYGNPHGKNFSRKYLELLVEFGRCDEGELRVAMSLFQIRH